MDAEASKLEKEVSAENLTQEQVSLHFCPPLLAIDSFFFFRK
jgi:hypothetical protein